MSSIANLLKNLKANGGKRPPTEESQPEIELQQSKTESSDSVSDSNDQSSQKDSSYQSIQSQRKKSQDALGADYSNGEIKNQTLQIASFNREKGFDNFDQNASFQTSQFKELIENEIAYEDSFKEDVVSRKRTNVSVCNQMIRVLKKRKNGLGDHKSVTVKVGTSGANQKFLSSKGNGIQLAGTIGKFVIFDSVMRQKKRLLEEFAALDAIKKELGFDLEKGQFIRNRPVDLTFEYKDGQLRVRRQSEDKKNKSNSNGINKAKQENKSFASKQVQQKNNLLPPSSEPLELAKKKEHSQQHGPILQQPVNKDSYDCRRGDCGSLSAAKAQILKAIQPNKKSGIKQTRNKHTTSLYQHFSILKNKEENKEESKEVHRVEMKMEDVVYILMKLDFISEREGEQKFDPKDLTEMAKSVELFEVEAGQTVFKQGDDSNCMYLLMEGLCLSTYFLATQDKQAMFFGKKKAHEDEIIVDVLANNRNAKENSEKMGGGNIKNPNSITNHKDDQQLEKAKSRKSSQSGGSSRSNRSSRSKRSRNSNSRRKQALANSIDQKKKLYYLTTIQDENEKESARLQKVEHPIYGHLVELQKMIHTLTNKSEQMKREQAQQQNHPLNQAIDRMHNSIKETEEQYQQNLKRKDHYINVLSHPDPQLDEQKQEQLLHIPSGHSHQEEVPQKSTGRPSQKIFNQGSQNSQEEGNEREKQANIQRSLTTTLLNPKSAARTSRNSKVHRSSNNVSSYGSCNVKSKLSCNQSRRTIPTNQLEQAPQKMSKSISKKIQKPAIKVGNLGSKLPKSSQGSKRKESPAPQAGKDDVLFNPVADHTNSHSLDKQSAEDGRLNTSSGGVMKDINVGNFSAEMINPHSDSSWENDSRRSDLTLSIYDIKDIGKDENGNLKELKLTDIQAGQQVSGHILVQAEKDPLVQCVHGCSLYTLKRCYFLLFHKDKYRKAVEACNARVKTQKIEELKKVELIKGYTRQSLKNMAKFLERKKLNRSQMLFKEGERADRVFFVIKGEFKVTKKIFIVDKNQDENNSQLETIYQTGSNGKSTVFPLMKRKNKNQPSVQKMQVLDLIMVTQHGILGDEDVIIENEDHRYMTSCECVSKEAEVYELKQEDFLRESKKQHNWKDIVFEGKVQIKGIVSLINDKREKFAKRVIQKNEVQKEVDINLTRQNKDANNMKDTVNQWTDVKSNQHIVDTENHFKRLVSEKINKTNQVKFTSQKSEVKISAQKSEQILSGFDRMKNPFPFKLYTVSINEIQSARPQTKSNTQALSQTQNVSVYKRSAKSVLDSSERKSSLLVPLREPNRPQVLIQAQPPAMTHSWSTETKIGQNKSERQSLDVNQITRFLPQDLRYGSIKPHTLSATLRERKNEMMMLRSGSLPVGKLRPLGPQQLMIQKQHMRQQAKGILHDHDLALKQIQSLRQESKKLQLDTKKKDEEASVGQHAEVSRATFLIRQSQLRENQFPQEQRGSYGHAIKRKDTRLQGVSALAQKIQQNMQVQNSMFGGSLMSKHVKSKETMYGSSGNLHAVKGKLLPVYHSATSSVPNHGAYKTQQTKTNR